mgnify:CR=1 FL=1
MTRYRFLLIGLALFLSSCGETAKRSAPEPEPEPEKALRACRKTKLKT